MRNALKILVFTGLSIGLLAKNVAAVETQPSVNQPVSVYAMPAVTAVVDDTHSLLPTEGRDLPLISTATVGTSDTVNQTTVEAIPTPTAFQAGVVLLLGMAAVRIGRHVRTALV